jgi:HSP20 family protein
MALARRERGDWPEMFRRLFDADSDPGWLRMEEFREGDDLVIRAELPGIDPDKDVEVSVSDGVLHIEGQREERSEQKEQAGYRSEFRYGRFARTIALPGGVDEGQVKAAYKDGVLEVRVPAAPQHKPEATKVPVTRS